MDGVYLSIGQKANQLMIEFSIVRMWDQDTKVTGMLDIEEYPP